MFFQKRFWFWKLYLGLFLHKTSCALSQEVLRTNEHVCRYPGPECGIRVAVRNPRQKGTRVPFSKIYQNLRVFAPIFDGFLLICKLFMTRVNNSANVYGFLNGVHLVF